VRAFVDGAGDVLGCMALDLDTRSAIRHPDLGRIVRAVLNADEHDESDWIEWKTDLDLTTKKGCFPIARAILGMANRLSASASLVCGGLGYVIVGVEPQNLTGTQGADPADLDQLLTPWLGGVEGPQYTPIYVQFEEKKVLVVVVEAPKLGDPIYTLRKEFDGARDGDVFVRKSGRTERASSLDIRALCERAKADSAAPELVVSLVGNVPLSWFAATKVNGALAEWVGTKRNEIEAAARAEEFRRNHGTNPALGHFAEHLVRLRDLTQHMTNLTIWPERRTLDEYLAEVAAWAGDVTGAGPAVIIDRYLQAGHGMLAVNVHNPSGRYLRNLMVEVHLESDQLTFQEPESHPAHLPPVPGTYGKTSPAFPTIPSVGPPIYSALSRAISGVTERKTSWTEQQSFKIMFNVGDLRQEGTASSETHYLVLLERPPGGVLKGTWKATVPEVHGVMRGTLAVAVCQDPVDLKRLLDSSPEAEQ
jgi:Putative DNA-binding domain